MTTVNSATNATASTKNSSVQKQEAVQDPRMDLFGTGMANDYFGSKCVWNDQYYQELNAESAEGDENSSSTTMTKPAYVPTSSVEDLYFATQIANSIAKEYSGKIPVMYSKNGFSENDIFAQALTQPQRPILYEQAGEQENAEKAGLDYNA